MQVKGFCFLVDVFENYILQHTNNKESIHIRETISHLQKYRIRKNELNY